MHPYMYVCVCPTFNGSQDDSGVVVCYDVSVAVLGLVDLQVGVLPGELLPWIDRLTHRGGEWERWEEE